MSSIAKPILGAAATILILTAALVGSLIYVAFYAVNYTVFQKIVVVIVSFIVAMAAVAILWIVWAGRKGYIRPWNW